jgi:hypothetical protein
MIIKKITQHFLKPAKNSIGAFVACVIALAGLTTPVYGQEWTFDPIVRLGAEVDDNANLSIRTDQEVEISGFTADLTARVDYLSSVTSFYVAPRVRWRKFDESEFDSTDLFVRLNYRYRTQASTFAIRAFGEREAVRTAERADTDLDIDDPLDITNDDSGFVQLGGDRDKYRIRPSWQYRFSNTFSLTAAVDYFDINYDDVFLDLLVDYTDTRGELLLSRALSDRTTGLLVGTVRRFENADEVLEFDGYGAMVGFERAISETTFFRALVGVDSANFDADNVDDETAVVADISVVRQLETIQMLAQYKRSITASGTRIPTIRDNFNLNFTRRLSERIAAGLGARIYTTELISGVGDAGRDYVQLTARLGWNLTRTFMLEFDISHTILDRGGLGGESADSNQAGIWFVYRPNRPTTL